MKDKLDFTGLAEPVVKRIKSYLEQLLSLIGEGLNSIVIYGSAASGEFDPKRSNINLLVVVEKLDLELLHKLQPFIKKGARKGIVAPLILTHEHMNTSSDVFPIEFLDMSDFHYVLWGQDPFARLAIGTENLRLECEEKLKGSLINLRQSYLEIADRRGPMMNLVSASITGMTSIFRGLVRLAGKKAPAGKKEVIELMADLYPVESGNFLKALEIKLAALRMTREEMDAFFASYLTDIEKLALHVDKMKKIPKVKKPAAKKAPLKSTARTKTKSPKSPSSRGRKSR